MADVVLFSSDAANSKRMALIVDDAVSPVPMRVEIRDAANTLLITHVLTDVQKAQIANLWHSDTDRAVQVKSDNPQLWVTLTRDNACVWSSDPAGNDTDTASNEVPLTAAQTSAVLGWLLFNFVP